MASDVADKSCFLQFHCGFGDAFTAHAKLLADGPQYAAARAELPDVTAFVDKMAAVYATDPHYASLLNEIIADLKVRAIGYEEYLKRIALLVRSVELGHAGDTPATLNTPGKRALYRNLKPVELLVAEEPDEQAASADLELDLALRIDASIKKVRPDAWRGVKPREQVIKAALHQLLQDDGEVERIFLIIKAQGEY